MIRLLIIADDFTGALDTGIQFQGEHTALRFGQNSDSYLKSLAPDTQVLIVDAETRHLPPQEAGAIVGQIAADAAAAGVTCIYKKTDSGLRGNIGAELAAVLEHFPGQVLHFVPALPRLNRITQNGVQYINGQEVAASVFGRDPFEPVKQSCVADIIAQQTSVPVTLASSVEAVQQGIAVYDAATVSDLEKIARDLRESGQFRLLAGCAGFAQMLPELLGITVTAAPPPKLPRRLATICGSINPITLAQMDAAESAGTPRIRLTVQQKLNDSNTIVECDGLGDPEGLSAFREKLGLSLAQMRCRISETMGLLLKTFLDDGLEATWMVTGGDTLMAFMHLAELHEMTPICEYTPGVVLTSVCMNGKTVYLLTKSGGFGEERLLLDLGKKLNHQ